MSDTARPYKRMLINVTVGIGISSVVGVLVMRSLIILYNPFYGLLIPFLLMGLVGSFWWRRQSVGGWSLWGIVIAETIGLFFALFAVLVPKTSHDEWGEWSLGLLGAYVVASPLIALVIYIGGCAGYWLLDRISVSRFPSS